MRLHNELTRTVEEFASQGGHVTVYVCGITPYDTTHLGHAFTYASFDILIRYLESLGHTVTYVQNVTDIDDDILRKARENGDDWRSLGDRWTAHFIRDMQALSIRPPDHYTRATEYIEGIINSVQRLLEVGVAYVAGGSVYFHVDDWPRFGELSDLPRPEMLEVANQRGNVPDDPHKRDPLDFVLWQAQAPGEPAWPSLWGPGRPGWHIECSTMSTHLLGNTIDIHGGGGDLIFPHHECEIAQAEAATGQRPFVRFWLHTAMVHHEGEKMSKSLGNLVMISDLLKDYSPDALRLYLGRHHYRQVWSYAQDELDGAEAMARRLREADRAPAGHGRRLEAQACLERFQNALADDLNVSAALENLAGLGAAIADGAGAGQDVRAAQETLRKMAAIFGLRMARAEPDESVSRGWDHHLGHFEAVA